MTPLVKVAAMRILFLWLKKGRLIWPLGMHSSMQCASTLHLLLVLNAIGPYIGDVSFAIGAVSACFEWNV